LLSPASHIEMIENGRDYFADQNSHPIFTIHCTKTNQTEVTVTSIDGSTVVFPPGSFVAGATYHIYIKQVDFNPEYAGFVGYRQLTVKK
jgi:hypothetical protein